jgi:phage/plasmid-like protein (TIGR03299 family)
MSANVESMFSTRMIQPWHKRGLVLNNPPTSEEAIVMAGMNWEVSKQKTFYSLEDGTQLEEIAGLFAIVRSDTRQVIGKVGRHFEPLQNVQAFKFFDYFVNEGLAEYETAGVLGHGETVWILARFNGPVNIGQDDQLRSYLLLANGHDGMTNVLIQPTDIRVVCQNTLMSSLGTGNVVKVRHTPSMTVNMKDIQDQIVRLHANRAGIHQAYEDMARTVISESDLEKFILSLWPAPEKYRLDTGKFTLAYQIWEAKQQALRRLLEAGAGTEKTWLKGTVWWLYNGVTELVDHYMANSRRIKDKTSYILRGDGAALKDAAFYRAVELVNDIHGTMVISDKQAGIDREKWIAVA